MQAAIQLLPLLRWVDFNLAVAAVAAADPLATCQALSRWKELSIFTPQMVVHTLGGLAQPSIPQATREELAQYFESIIRSGDCDPIVHEIYMVLLILHPSNKNVHQCDPSAQMENLPPHRISCHPRNQVHAVSIQRLGSLMMDARHTVVQP